MRELFRKYELFLNIINYVLCDLYACKNHFMKSLWFSMEDFYIRKRYKVKYLSKHYYPKMDRKYDMDYFEYKFSFMLMLLIFTPVSLVFAKLSYALFPIVIIYRYFIFQGIITLSILKAVPVNKKGKYKFKVFDRIRYKRIARWRCMFLCVIIIDIILCTILLNV